MVSSLVSPLRGSKRGTRMSPASMTTRTPSMVKLVSAIEVARTILRRPEGAGRMACSCSSCGSSPCSGAMMMSGLSRLSCSCRSTRRISAMPGRNTNRLPGSTASACLMLRTTAESRCPSIGRSRYCVVTAKSRPSQEIVVASGNSAVTAAQSSVADMTSRRRSSRKSRCDSLANANPRSACKLRS